MQDTHYIERRVVWSSWYSNSHVLILDRALKRLHVNNIDVHEIKHRLAKGAQRPWNAKVMEHVKIHFQGAVASRIAALDVPDAEFRVRHKMKRWKVNGVEAHVARRVPPA